MSVDEPIDILVVGLGPAGSRAARAAARTGLRVLGIDRRRKPGQPVQCAEFVPTMLDQSVEGLDAVTRQRVDAMMTYVEDEAPHATTDFRGRMLDRGAFDAALVRAARQAGADCRFGVSAAEIGRDGAVTLTDGTVLRPRLVIGADGPRSNVGAAIGRINREIVETRQIAVPLLRRHDATDIFLSAGIVGGYGWLFPRGDIANVGLGAVHTQRHRLKPLLDVLHRRLAGEGRVGRGILGFTGGSIPAGGMLDPVGALDDVPVLLAGDAAGLTNPITGAGIGPAVMSGTLAGEAAAARLAGDADALQDYAEEIEALFGAANARALMRRRDIMRSHAEGAGPSPDELRAGWIAWPEYWATPDRATTAETTLSRSPR